jgi:hypothetical protein
VGCRSGGGAAAGCRSRGGGGCRSRGEGWGVEVGGVLTPLTPYGMTQVGICTGLVICAG